MPFKKNLHTKIPFDSEKKKKKRKNLTKIITEFGFNGYFPWIGYVVSFRIVLTSPKNKW